MSRSENENELEKILDMVDSCRAIVLEAIADSEDAEVCVELVHSLVDRGLLDLSGTPILAMDCDLQMITTAANLARSSLADAEKAFRRATNGLLERDVALRIEEGVIGETCLREFEDSLGIARARLQEAREFAVETKRRRSALRLPGLRVV